MAARIDIFKHLPPWDDKGFDILAFVIEPEDPAGAFRIGKAAKEVDILAEQPLAGIIAANRVQGADDAAGFFGRFAPRDVFRVSTSQGSPPARQAPMRNCRISTTSSRIGS